jgi:hypothetical protein
VRALGPNKYPFAALRMTRTFRLFPDSLYSKRLMFSMPHAFKQLVALSLFHDCQMKATARDRFYSQSLRND